MKSSDEEKNMLRYRDLRIKHEYSYIRMTSIMNYKDFIVGVPATSRILMAD